MIFNINNYNDHHVMHCATQEEADYFTKHLHDMGKKWCSGASYIHNTKFGIVSAICYRFTVGEYSRREYYESSLYGYTILEFSDFEWDGYNDEISEDESLIDALCDLERTVRSCDSI